MILRPCCVQAPPEKEDQRQREEQARQQGAATSATAFAGVGQVGDVADAADSFLPVDLGTTLVAAILGRGDGRAAVATDVSGGHGGGTRKDAPKRQWAVQGGRSGLRACDVME